MITSAPKPDWEKIRMIYRTGQFFSIRALARDCGVPYSTLRDKINGEKWEKDLSDQVRYRTRQKVIRATAQPKPLTFTSRARKGATDRPESSALPTSDRSDNDSALVGDEKTIERAAEAAATEVLAHQQSARDAVRHCQRMLDQVGAALDEIERYQRSKKKKDSLDAKVFAFLGPKDGVADVLGKATRALSQAIPQARTAFGLDETGGGTKIVRIKSNVEGLGISPEQQAAEASEKKKQV